MARATQVCRRNRNQSDTVLRVITLARSGHPTAMCESEPPVTAPPRTPTPAIVWCCETPVLENPDERSERDKRELRQGPTWSIQHQRAHPEQDFFGFNPRGGEWELVFFLRGRFYFARKRENFGGVFFRLFLCFFVGVCVTHTPTKKHHTHTHQKTPHTHPQKNTKKTGVCVCVCVCVFSAR